nr:facilitated trehalose transporter Tret1-like [Danaus plexippus plexippus]
MESCEYQELKVRNECDKERLWCLLKQLLICSTVWTQFFMTGLSVGATTVMVPQLKREQSTEIDAELISWLYSTTSFAILPWVFILPYFTSLTGRKFPQIVNSIITTTSFLILYFGSEIKHIIISEIIQGYFHAANINLMVIILTDYSSVKYRGIFLGMKDASFFWGLWMANFIGTFYHWKNVALLGIICSLYTYNVIFWKESPVWLASKGRIEKCKMCFRWIRGTDKDSEKELQELISDEPQIKYDRIRFIDTISSPEFYKPLLLSLVAVAHYHLSAKMVCSLFVLDILKIITKDENSAYTGMLILDGVTVFGTYVGSYLVKILKRRTLYMFTSCCVVACLLIISLYLYLVKWKVLEENNYVLMVFFCMHSAAVSCGPVVLACSVFGEVISPRFQATSYTVTGGTFCIINMIIVKCSHQMFRVFDVSGTFLFYGVMCCICTSYLYMFLPETRNKTPKEIELYFRPKAMGDM